MEWTGRAPAPNDSQSAWGACQEQAHYHGSFYRSCSDGHRNRYGQDHSSHGRPRFARARERVSRGRIAPRFANLPPCLIGIEAGMATHYVARELAAWPRCEAGPADASPFRQGHKKDSRDAHAVAEAVQRPTTRFVPVKTEERLDLQALHRVRSRLVSERTAVINQIRGFLLERGISDTSPSAATATCACSSFKQPGSFWYGRRAQARLWSLARSRRSAPAP